MTSLAGHVWTKDIEASGGIVGIGACRAKYQPAFVSQAPSRHFFAIRILFDKLTVTVRCLASQRVVMADIARPVVLVIADGALCLHFVFKILSKIQRAVHGYLPFRRKVAEPWNIVIHPGDISRALSGVYRITDLLLLAHIEIYESIY